MAKRQAPAQRAGAPIKTRLTDDQVRAKGMNPFLRPEHCRDGEAFKLTGWSRLSPDGTQIIVEVENERGNLFDLGIREGSPDHKIMFKAFGRDWRKWPAGGILVSIVEGRKEGTSFVNIAGADPNEPF